MKFSLNQTAVLKQMEIEDIIGNKIIYNYTTLQLYIFV